MSYRDTRKLDTRKIDDRSTKVDLIVTNGSTIHIAIPCFYLPAMELETKQAELDYRAYPYPESPDKTEHLIPQMIELGTPIALSAEGYTDVEIATINAPSGFKFTGTISEHVIKLTCMANCILATKKNVEVVYSVLIKGTVVPKDSSSPIEVKDLVCDGVVTITPAPVRSI